MKKKKTELAKLKNIIVELDKDDWEQIKETLNSWIKEVKEDKFKFLGGVFLSLCDKDKEALEVLSSVEHPYWKKWAELKKTYILLHSGEKDTAKSFLLITEPPEDYKSLWYKWLEDIKTKEPAIEGLMEQEHLKKWIEDKLQPPQEEWYYYYLKSIKTLNKEEKLSFLTQAIHSLKFKMEIFPSWFNILINKMLAYLYAKEAILYYDIGDYKQCLDMSIASLRASPTIWPLYYLAGASYIIGGSIRMGKNFVEKFITEVSKSSSLKDEEKYYLEYSAKHILAQIYLNEHNFEEALSLYTKIIEAYPNWETPYLNAGFSLYSLDRIEESEKMFSKLLEINPRNVLAYNNLAFIYFKNNNIEKAKELLEKALEIDPGYLLLYCNLSALYLRELALEKVVEIAKTGLKIKGEEKAELFIAYPSLFWKEEIAETEAYELVSSIPASLALLCNLGTALAGLKRWEESNLCFEKLIKLAPQSHWGWKGRAFIKALKKKFKEAYEDISKAYNLNPKDKLLLKEKLLLAKYKDYPTKTEELASALGKLLESNKVVKNQELIEEISALEVTPGENKINWESFFINYKELGGLEKEIENTLVFSPDLIVILEMVLTRSEEK